MAPLWLTLCCSLLFICFSCAEILARSTQSTKKSHKQAINAAGQFWSNHVYCIAHLRSRRKRDNPSEARPDVRATRKLSVALKILKQHRSSVLTNVHVVPRTDHSIR